MRRILAASAVLALLSGCGMKSAGNRDADFVNPRNTSSIGAPLSFALPGVPLQSEMPGYAGAEPVPPPKQAGAKRPPSKYAPAEVPGTKADYEFHLSEARRYASKKKHLSAAAEYKAALGLLLADDPLTVHALERQGAMMLRANSTAKARKHFIAAIAKAKDLNLRNNDLAKAHLGLGFCQEKSKQIPEAIASYEKVLKFSTSSFIKRRVEKTISDLKKKQ